MSSEESDVELDMEGVIADNETEDTHEMGDPDKKEMTDDEMTKFDEARGQAMSIFSEVIFQFSMLGSPLKNGEGLLIRHSNWISIVGMWMHWAVYLSCK